MIEPIWQLIIIIFIVVLILLIWFFHKKKQGKPSENVAAGKEVPDDLKIIEGIGPKIFSILNDAGINTFEQLAKAKVEDLKKILDEAKISSIADPGSWPEQAKLAATGEMDELKKLQDNLKGGKKA